MLQPMFIAGGVLAGSSGERHCNRLAMSGQTIEYIGNLWVRAGCLPVASLSFEGAQPGLELCNRCGMTGSAYHAVCRFQLKITSHLRS
jgi:hypothetical protein